MQIRDFRLLFSAGDLVKAEILNDPNHKGFNLFFYRKGKSDPVPVETQRGGVRTFNTIQTAINNAKDIGFNTFSVTIN